MRSAHPYTYEIGHDRGADEVAQAAKIQEDAHAIAITSYQGGAVEMFTHTKNLPIQRMRD